MVCGLEGCRDGTRAECEGRREDASEIAGSSETENLTEEGRRMSDPFLMDQMVVVSQAQKSGWEGIFQGFELRSCGLLH